MLCLKRIILQNYTYRTKYQHVAHIWMKNILFLISKNVYIAESNGGKYGCLLFILFLHFLTQHNTLIFVL